jgi:predicted transcriptional regulator
MAQVHTEVPDDVFARAKVLAIKDKRFFKAWVALAIEEKVDREEKKAAK